MYTHPLWDWRKLKTSCQTSCQTKWLKDDEQGLRKGIIPPSSSQIEANKSPSISFILYDDFRCEQKWGREASHNQKLQREDTEQVII